ncbi:MAG TPA: sulfotransferase [Rhizomicrobium sp.]|nr:sulfotransferase [Rhizomicrobium sp.]
MRLLAAGNIAVAERQAAGIVAQAPDSVEALYLLAQCVRRRPAGETEYEHLLRRVLAIALHPQASLELAQLLSARGELEQSEEYARSAVAHMPKNPLAHRTMGIIFLNTGRPAAAEFHFRKIVDLAGEQPRACALMADALKLQGKLDESEAWLGKATALDPTNAEVWVNWCRMAEARRRLPDAWEKLRRAEALAPDLAAVCLARAILIAREGRDSEAEQCLADGLVHYPDDPGLLFERGRIRRKLERYEEAWGDFVEANRVSRERDGLEYAGARVSRLIAQLMQFFTRGRMAALPRASEKAGAPQPIFILGFPRSGTTLVEQILAQHPLVRPGDELEFVAQVASLAPRWIGSPNNYPECLAELAVGDNVYMANHLRDAYFERAAQAGLVSGPQRFFTDKMPLNELHLGLISILFPHTPLVLVRRHPLDVVCSNFAQHIRHGFNQSFDLSSSARHYAAMEDLIAHYRRELDLNLLDIRYEDVIARPEQEIRRLLEFVGLPFDQRCLDFNESERVPRTISYAQVGEKLHVRSVFAYRHFRKHLDGATEILAPVMARLGYEVD